MVFERNIGGIDVNLQIDNYESPPDHEFGDWWCDCSFSFRMGGSTEIINYRVDHDETLTPEEVDEIADVLTDLIDGKITEPRELPMTEPDFVFLIYPIKDLRNDPQYTYVRPGYEFRDIYIEWRIYFWNEGLTDNFLTVTLQRDDIISLRDFFDSIRKIP